LTSPKAEQIAAFLEVSEVYISQCQSVADVDSLGQEIASVKTAVGATNTDMEKVKRVYLAKRKELA